MMMGTLLHKTEHWLYLRGFSAAPVRRLMAVQLLVSAAFVGVGIPMLLWSVWPLVFGIGASLAACGFWHVARIAQAHIHDLSIRIADMQAMQRSLQTLVQCCHGDDRPDCPILDDLAKPSNDS